MAERFGGKYSPGGANGPGAGGSRASGPGASGPPPPRPSRRPHKVSLRARLMFLLPVPLLLAGLGSISRGSASEMLGELGAFAGLMAGAALLNEGLRAEASYDARAVARPPAIPRKLFAAALTGVSIAAAGVLSLGQALPVAVVFGAVAAGAQVLAFGLDPMRRKGMEGVDDFSNERVARAVDQAEELVRQTVDAAKRIGDRRLEGRIDRLCDQARDVFRTIERDPRDLPRARTFLSVYLLGLRDATTKFAEVWNRSRDPGARVAYEDLLGDLETSFGAQRTHLLEEDRSDLDVEIEVLRDRLKQDGLIAR